MESKTLLIAMNLAILLFILRLVLWMRLQHYLSAAELKVIEALDLLQKHGNTFGELESAGVLETLNLLKNESGELYRKAVRVAAVLTWPMAWLPYRKALMTGAYDKVGLFSGSSGSFDAYEDTVRGYAINTNYYPPEHTMGMLASLRTITPVF